MLGIFDSGIGGLSVLKEIKKLAPQIDVVYFGDIKNAPYGVKTQEELKKLTIKGVKILLENGAINILSACNSISSFMILGDLKNLFDKPFSIVEMIEPTVSKFKSHKDITIFATPATIEAGVYQDNFKKEGIEIKTFAISELAGAIDFGASEEEIEKIIDRAVSTAMQSVSAETALLCCTHYPFVQDKFEKAFKKYNQKTKVFNPAKAVAKKTIKKFNLSNPSSLRGFLRKFFKNPWQSRKNGKIKFIISQDSPIFRKKVEELFGDSLYSIKILN